MKLPRLFAPLSLMLLTLYAVPSWAQDSIYRCGNEYTNNAAEAKARGCKTLQGGNITVIPGTRPAASSVRSASAPASGPRVGSDEQRTRDAGARAILESELRTTQSRLDDLQREYNNGQPDQLGGEAHNHQKYLDRVEQLKASIARTEADIAGIKRELARLNPGQ